MSYVTNLFIILYLSVKFDDIHLSGFKVFAETGFHLKPLTVTLILGVATYNLHAYLLINLYVSVKFHQVYFSSF